MPYISNGQGYTYGVKTLTEIDSITGMVAGETVFCSDNFRKHTYDGDLWMCSDYIKLTNQSGGSLARKDLVVIDTGTAASVTTTTTYGNDLVVGPVAFGGNDGDPVAVVTFGHADVESDSGTVLGSVFMSATTVKKSNPNSLPTSGSFAIAVEDIVSAGPCKSIVKPKIEFF